MIHRSVAAAHLQLPGRAEGLGKPRFDGPQGCFPVPQPRLHGCHGRRQRTSRAVAVARLNPPPADHHDVGGQQARCVDQGIGAVVAVEVAALDQDGGPGSGREPLALLQRLGPAGGFGFAEQHAQFRQVGGDEVSQREERAEGRLGGLLQQAVAAGGHHDRVKDHDAGTDLLQPAADRGDHLLVTEHPDFHGVNADVVADGVELRGQERRRRNMDAAHPPGVLGGQRRDGGHSVAAAGCDAFQVRLDAGAARRIRAGDGQDAGNVPGRGRRVRVGRRRRRRSGGSRGRGQDRCCRQRRHPFAGANRTGSTGLDLSRHLARHPVSVPQPSG